MSLSGAENGAAEITHMRTPRIRLRSQRGQSMAEFAIVAPVLLLVLMGIVQLGVVYNNWVTLTDAARAGARKAAVCRSGCSPDATTATVNAVQNSAADLTPANLNVTVTSTWAQGADATVTATYPWSINVMGVVVASGNLTATTTERVE
jgi:Flp pilus assembly protein TadG